MNHPTTKIFSALALAAVLSSGCISHNETVTKDVARRKVEFENESAGRIFYEALSHVPNSGTKLDKTSEFEIPVVLDYKRHVVNGPNAAFNEAVERCDTNKDGKVTEIEAKIFVRKFAASINETQVLLKVQEHFCSFVARGA